MNNNMMNDNEFLSFDGPITAEESQFVTLPEGTYPFQVMSMDRKRYSGNSTKIPNGAPFAEVQLRFDGGNNGTTTVSAQIHAVETDGILPLPRSASCDRSAVSAELEHRRQDRNCRVVSTPVHEPQR